MTDNQTITDGKIKIDGLFHKYLQSKEAIVTVDPEGNINFEGKNLPKTQEEVNLDILNFFFEELEIKTEQEVLDLLESEIEVEVVAVQSCIVRPPVLDIEPSKPAPTPAPAPAEPEGFLTSWYNWIFGAKQEEKLEPTGIKIAPPKPVM